MDASKTNGIAATAAHITNAWGIFDGDTNKFLNGAGALATPSGGDSLWATNVSGVMSSTTNITKMVIATTDPQNYANASKLNLVHYQANTNELITQIASVYAMTNNASVDCAGTFFTTAYTGANTYKSAWGQSLFTDFQSTINGNALGIVYTVWLNDGGSTAGDGIMNQMNLAAYGSSIGGSAIGVDLDRQLYGTTMDASYGIRLKSPTIDGASTITNANAGIVIEDQTSAQAGSSYNVWSKGIGKNRFEGDVQAGATGYFNNLYSTNTVSAGATNQWKLGAYATNTVTLITTNYVTVTIDGVDYKLAIVR